MNSAVSDLVANVFHFLPHTAVGNYLQCDWVKYALFLKQMLFYKGTQIFCCRAKLCFKVIELVFIKLAYN